MVVIAFPSLLLMVTMSASLALVVPVGGQLSNPSSLAIDMYGFILITEENNHRVSVFNKDGVFIHCFGFKGSANGQFSSPHGIALSPNGSVYVTDHYNEKIQNFSSH